jgi:hypothetical protein
MLEWRERDHKRKGLRPAGLGEGVLATGKGKE